MALSSFALPNKSTIAAVALFIAVGLALVSFRLGNPLARLSYDLPFRAKSGLREGQKPYAPPDVVMVMIDETSRQTLGVMAGQPLPRTLHAQLVERLTRGGARVVFYDLLFDVPSADPAVDEAFAAAIKQHGNVVLAGSYEKVGRDGAFEEIITPPSATLRSAARGWGVAALLALDPDNVVRRLGLGVLDAPLATWLIAELVGAPVTQDAAARPGTLWLNYYGPSGTLPSCRFSEALEETFLPPDYFRGKIVCIGGRPPPVGRKFGEDEFGDPYSRWGEPYSAGLEVHVTALLNILRSEWLNRMKQPLEFALVALIGLGAGAAAYGLSPARGFLVLGLAAALIVVGSFALHVYGHVWWNWLVPAAVQLPLAAVWSSATRYAGEARRRAQLRRAFSLYLSPQMADRISEEQMDLKPGGKLVEATVLFTDCKGFTTTSEELKDPQRISDLMIAYFTVTSRHVLENDGTIIKYIGDAVFACWNAPLTVPDHPFKAARAAWAMHEASKEIVLGRALTTRVGVCTGEVLAGNLGSPYRFDYTAIGDTTNFASRLESLNKQLGTDVLVADSTRQRLGDRFIVRALGNFIVAGKTNAVAIHELIAPIEHKPADLAWLVTWDEALKALRQGDFVTLQKALREVVWQRGGSDGPSEFYLKYLARLEAEHHLQEWTGTIQLTEK